MFEVLLIGRDSQGNPRVIDLSSVTVEVGSRELEAKLASAREALEFYASGGADTGSIAADALRAME
jgi:hypothetical protein